MAESKHILSKQRLWSADINRDLEWQKLKTKQRHRLNDNIKDLCRSKSDVTDDDVKELKACFDLGFGFDKLDDMDPKLTHAFPALELYAAVKRGYNNCAGRMLSRSSSSISTDSSSSSSSSNVANTSIVDPSDDPQKVKAKLKQWAQLVRCSIMETSSKDKKAAE
ncbi:ribonuclease H-like domain-containing protein [Tanacetum coccineum]